VLPCASSLPRLSADLKVYSAVPTDVYRADEPVTLRRAATGRHEAVRAGRGVFVATVLGQVIAPAVLPAALV